MKPEFHILLRIIAVFFIAPILIYKGYLYNDKILLILGVGTLIIDGFTLYKSILHL